MIKQLCVELQERRLQETDANSRYSHIFDNVRGAMFYATPHAGSAAADSARCLLGFLPCIKGSAVLPRLRILDEDSVDLHMRFQAARMPLRSCRRFVTFGLYEAKALKVRPIDPRNAALHRVLQSHLARAPEQLTE